MPGVEEEERDDEVEKIGRHQGNYESEEYLVLPYVGNGESVCLKLGLYRLDRDEDRSEHEVSKSLLVEFRIYMFTTLHHDECPEYDHRHVEPI